MLRVNVRDAMKNHHTCMDDKVYSKDKNYPLISRMDHFRTIFWPPLWAGGQYALGVEWVGVFVNLLQQHVP